MTDAPERKAAIIYPDLLAEGIHVGLRKASEHPKSGDAWRAISDLPNEEWAAVVEFAIYGSTAPTRPMTVAEAAKVLLGDAYALEHLAHHACCSKASIAETLRALSQGGE